jgi:hypothetical protein
MNGSSEALRSACYRRCARVRDANVEVAERIQYAVVKES